MATIGGGIRISTTLSQTGTGFPGTTQPTVQLSQDIKATFAPGTAAGQADLKYTKTLTLAATPTVLDLKALLDIFGGAVAFVRVRSLSIVVKSTTNTHVLLVGYATTTANAWTGPLSNPGQITVGPSYGSYQGALVMIAPNTTGWAVGSSSKLLQLDPGANTFSVDVEIVGASA